MLASASRIVQRICGGAALGTSTSSKGSLTVEQVRASEKAQDWIELNADKCKSCLVNTDAVEWLETGAPGVARKLIERVGGEVARATSIVRFGPDRAFPAHTHGGGEEFLVLQGAWNDEWAVQPKYSYVRNYIGSRHAPTMGPDGCTILVKLRQMCHEHREPEHTQWDFSSSSQGWRPCDQIKGRLLLDVYKSPVETVHFERWPPKSSGAIEVPKHGEEVFVVEGSMSDDLGEHRLWSWARNSVAGQVLQREAGPEGCLLYIKSGHLASPEVGVGE